MALFSRKNLKYRKWVTTDDILLLLDNLSKVALGPITTYSILVDRGEVKDIEDLYREPVQLELRTITLGSNGKKDGKYNFVTDHNIEQFKNLLKNDRFYNRILLTENIRDNIF